MFSSSHWSFHKPEKSDRLFLAGRQVGAGHETSSTFSALLLCTNPLTPTLYPHTHTHSHLPCTHTPTPTHTYPVPLYPHPHNANSNYHTIYTPSPLLPSAPYTAPTAAQPTTPTSPSSTLLPTEQPPPYSSVSGQNLFVQCRVCQHVIHVASGTQTRVVKCSNCREATVGEGRERGGDG